MNKKEVQCSYNLMKFFGELVAGADHEINNLLLMVQGSAHILLSENPSLEARSMAIDAITDKTQRIKEIMEELRELLSDGSKDPLKDNYVKELTNKAITLCKTRFKNHRIFFSVNISETSAIECKQTQIVQALLAILNSAHDSLIQGKEKWIQVQVFDLDEEVVIEVSDSGKPFSTEDEQRAFDLTYTSASGRLGVSLALAKNIINSHGGQIEVFNKESVPTVRAILPRSQPLAPMAGVVKVIHQEVEIYEENVTVLQHKRAA